MLIKILIAALLCVTGAQADQSPVFVWGASSPAKPALQKVEQNEFASILSPLFKDNMVVAFLEEELSIDDFCYHRTMDYCYEYLKKVAPITYYSLVENPVDAVRSLTVDHREYNQVDKTGKLGTPLECAVGKVVIVNFEDTEEDREDRLEKHDAAIAAITKEMTCPVVYLYMSAPSPTKTSAQIRVRREAAAPEKGYVFRHGSQFLLYFTKLELIHEEKREEIVITTMTVKNYTDMNMFNVQLSPTNGPALSFNVSLSNGYYVMGNVLYNEISFHSNDVSSLTTFSYTCGNLTQKSYQKKVGNDLKVETGYRFQWHSLQFQAPFGSSQDPEFVFGSPWYCVGFVTPGILMGLFVVVMLLAITFTGICWMVDLKTMDRFDDPKGKTITINANE